MAQLISIMTFENTPFKDFPIEFKEINPQDFKLIYKPNKPKIKKEGFIVENGREKIIIEPDRDKGYINDVFQEQLLLDHKNTVVVNAAVGQGKSYAIIQTIKRYYDIMQSGGQKYLVMVASPFVSLVKQYCEDIKKAGIPKDKIFDYSKLGREGNPKYLNKPIQVITVNTLLGNPGEDGFKNSEVKREYINSLIKQCEANNVKVVFVYDEIHDSYHNFKMEYIFNLWKWRNVIIKNFILSATYNEASKVVIEYLAELTDMRIKIIESKRVRFPEKQSSLHLHFSPAHNFSNETPEIKGLVKELLAKGKKIDILSYSKSLAKSLMNKSEDVGKMLIDANGRINDCTSELVSNQRAENKEPKNKYDNKECNVGTNFKTGVSIKKNNHAFIIIMPPKSTKLWFRNKYGIFSDGINSVIQALARQRVKGEIHIVLPKPEHFNYESLSHSGMNEEQERFFINIYEQIKYHKEPDKLGKYFKLNRQNFLQWAFYETKLYGNVEKEIEYVQSLNRDGLSKLEFQSFEQFKLEEGEDFLANEYPYFGEDISTYVTYAALTNQFINCVLKEIRFKTTLFFKKGELQKGFYKYFKQYFGEDYYYSTVEYFNFRMFYQDMRTTFFKEYEIKYYNGKKWANVMPYNNKEFETQLILFVAKMYFGRNYWCADLVKDFKKDVPYTRSMYFLDCIRFAENFSSTENNTNSGDRVKFYLLLNYFKNKLNNKIEEYNARGNHYFYLPNNLIDGMFTSDDIVKFIELESLMESDPYLANNIFEFKRRFEDKTNIQDKLKTFYKILLEDFFTIQDGAKPKIRIGDERVLVVKIASVSIIPISEHTVNLISSSNYIEERLELFDEEILKQYGSWDNYQAKINELLDN